MSDEPLRPDQFFIGVMRDGDTKYYGAVSPAPWAVPAMFFIVLMVGVVIGSVL